MESFYSTMPLLMFFTNKTHPQPTLKFDVTLNTREAVQRDFLRYTSQQILKVLRNEQSPIQEDLVVNAKDRKRQVWERNSLSISLWSSKVLWQKIYYIHQNPVKARLCKYAEDYYYSSASFYYSGDRRWDFLLHVDG
ncbi:hypothetical protein ACFQ21_08900 [Ohtaekwangia kribbensis]|uniref:Uncharacterized protein n=1 Tax=Ohtaekwangia kribbensis TaxID=688913 RepID=A0ABW3JZN1_9BACT